MNNRLRWVWLIGAALILSIDLSRAALANHSCTADHAPGVVLVRYRSDAIAAPEAPQLNASTYLSQIGAWVMRAPIGQECITIELLRRGPNVLYAELDYAAHAAGVITPTDPGWVNQWGPIQINAPAAWSVITGTSDVTIAVIDSGIKLDHEDLAAQLWTNLDEIPGNGIDDDGNGKIDDVHGWHFYHMWIGSSYIPSEDANVTDDFGHGTHVAGIAAAATNNDVGIAGIAWNARVMPIKVLDQYGTGWYSDIAAGIMYAADNGARVINLSLGGIEDSQLLRDAVDYARGHGALVIASTGNTGSAVLYPAAYEPVLAVAATDANDQVASFSNYGPQVDVAAPGVNIYSTWPWVIGYFTKSGTSMAAPHVAGLAALIWSLQPALSASSVTQIMTETACDVVWPGWDQYTGWGRIDAYAAVSRAATYRVAFLPVVLQRRSGAP